VEYAAANHIVGGYSDGAYRPDVNVDRGQMAVFVARSIVYPTGDGVLSYYRPPLVSTFRMCPPASGRTSTLVGRQHPVQRCRTHKLRNVLGYLPKELQKQTAAVLRAVWKLAPKEGMARLRTQIEWLERS